MRKINLPKLQAPAIQHVWLALPLAISFIAMNLTPIKEGDLWWHLKLGEVILATRQIPQMDSFSFTAAGQTYFFSYSWLSDVIFHLLARFGGLGALVLVQAGVGLSLAGLLLHQSRQRGVPAALAAALALSGWIGLYPYSSTRPQILSFLLFAVFFTLCSDYIQRGVNRLWLLPVLMLAWVNLHSAWLMGLILWVICLGGALLQRWWDAARAVSPRPLLGWGIISLLVLPLNPEGFAIYRSLLSAGSNPINQQFVSEWQPLVITNMLSWAFFGLLAAWIVGLACTARRSRLYEVALMLAFAAFGLRYLRMPPFFYIVAVPIIAETLAGINLDTLRTRFARVLSAGTDLRRAGLINTIFLVILLGTAMFSLPPIRLALSGKTESSLISNNFPVQAISAIIQPPQRIFSLPEWGGYLIWSQYPPATVFVDGRVELFPQPVWEDYLRIVTADENWQDLLDQYGVDMLVLSKDRQARLILNAYQKGWNCLTEDEVAIILSRQPAAGFCPSLVNRENP